MLDTYTRLKCFSTTLPISSGDIWLVLELNVPDFWASIRFEFAFIDRACYLEMSLQSVACSF